jgi:large subunit ribosomal protein L23
MAIFNSKKSAKASPAKAAEVKDVRGKLAVALTAPWLSEKALIMTEKGVYAFHVPKEATKHDVALAVERVYKVTPRRVTMVNLPAKKVSLRTRRGFGTKSGRRKAYVHLKKGDTIQFA